MLRLVRDLSSCCFDLLSWSRCLFAQMERRSLSRHDSSLRKRFREGYERHHDRRRLRKRLKFILHPESVTTQAEDGPHLCSKRQGDRVCLRDLLYTIPVDAEGHPCGPAVKPQRRDGGCTDLVRDSSHLLYLGHYKLRLIDRSEPRRSPVPVDLLLSRSERKPTRSASVSIRGRFWKGSGAEEIEGGCVYPHCRPIGHHKSVRPHSSTPPAGVTRTIRRRTPRFCRGCLKIATRSRRIDLIPRGILRRGPFGRLT